MRKLLIREQIAAEIKRRIAAGVYARGAFMPTERQLAEEFRTSRTTVSRALGELESLGMIEQTPGRGTRVLPLSERPSAGAVGVVLMGRIPHAVELALQFQGIQETLAGLSLHHEVVIGREGEDVPTADELTERFAGVLFIEALGLESVAEELEARRFPCVVSNLEKGLNVSATWVDHRKSTRAATRVLAALGHRDIVFVTRAFHFFFYREAHEGYRAALAEVGIPYDEERVLAMESNDSIGAYLRVRDYLQSHPRPTGVVAARDYLANGACRALVETGAEIGRDVSVIGFDDLTWAPDHPYLTTFREPARELGAAAVEMLQERLVSGWRPPERREVEAPLVLRRSVGPCPGAPPSKEPPLLMRPFGIHSR